MSAHGFFGLNFNLINNTAEAKIIVAANVIKNKNKGLAPLKSEGFFSGFAV
jgi:hypothetical protein